MMLDSSLDKVCQTTEIYLNFPAMFEDSVSDRHVLGRHTAHNIILAHYIEHFILFTRFSASSQRIPTLHGWNLKEKERGGSV